MLDTLINFLTGCVVGLGWWGMGLVLLVFTQLTIFAVTLYLHRSQAHRGVDFHPVIAHFFRFWTWLTTSMITKEWVAIHRKHHAKVETDEDPHSPVTKGIGMVFWRGVELYREARAMRADIEQYGRGARGLATILEPDIEAGDQAGGPLSHPPARLSQGPPCACWRRPR